VPKALLLGYNIDRWQIPLNSEQRRLRYVSSVALRWKAFWEGRIEKYSLDVFADRVAVTLPEPDGHLIDPEVVRGNVALHLGYFPFVSSARGRNLPLPFRLALLILLLRLGEHALSILDSNLVPLLATKDPAQPSPRFGFEVCPIGRRHRGAQRAQV